jgi:Rv2525c-like, glycoside hydrolase-like domain
MTLQGQVQDAISSVPGFDCDAALSANLARQFFTQGYKLCFRYLPSGRLSSQDLTKQEAMGILNSGLALMPVQHAHKRGWFPNQKLGRQDGQEASTNSATVGFPHGVSLWCDLEGVNSSAQAQDVIDYCGAWYKAVSAAGYIPGLYVGAEILLNGKQLYDLPFQHYWRSQSQVPDIPQRGYQVVQFDPPIQMNGVRVDLDVVLNDNQGGAAQWLRVKTAILGK